MVSIDGFGKGGTFSIGLLAQRRRLTLLDNWDTLLDVAKKQTAIRLNPLTLKALQTEAKRNQETVSDLIRRVLDRYVFPEKAKAKEVGR